LASFQEPMWVECDWLEWNMCTREGGGQRMTVRQPCLDSSSTLGITRQILDTPDAWFTSPTCSTARRTIIIGYTIVPVATGRRYPVP
jgi:hypothetical protein